ncbi:hypothetical protein TNCV_222791 [Trichonephila clavipes]|nr:hypothetical protein TNCV_222791 [Trichonephila clavipes]
MRVHPITSGNGSQMTPSSWIGVHETFRSTSSTARLSGGIFQNLATTPVVTQHSCVIQNKLCTPYTPFPVIVPTKITVSPGFRFSSVSKPWLKDSQQRYLNSHNLSTLELQDVTFSSARVSSSAILITLESDV